MYKGRGEERVPVLLKIYVETRKRVGKEGREHNEVGRKHTRSVELGVRSKELGVRSEEQ